MKKRIQYLKVFLLALFVFFFTGFSFAQEPPHPDNAGAGGGTTNGGPIGGAAGLAGGIGILLAMGGAYGARKIYRGWKKLND